MSAKKPKNLNIVVFFSYAESVGASYAETSAKLNEAIEDLFLQLTKGK